MTTSSDMLVDGGVSPGGRVGVLLINLGTPDAPDPPAIRRYLKEFLSDRRVVEIPPLVWQPILRGVILPTRPAKSARAYRQIWTTEGSPLAAITIAQAQGLQQRLGDGLIVRYAMRYGHPSIAGTLADMRVLGCDRILIAPLYPQYCGATTASAHDAVFAALGSMRWQPAIRTLPPYFEDPAYITALAESVRTSLDACGSRPDALLASFHGMPQRTRDLGDPYYTQCLRTAALLQAATGQAVHTTFQSRFGKAKWLEPATDQELQRLAATGIKRVAVVAPGFAADCVETLEELAIRGQEQFVEAGGEQLVYIPALNASEAGMALIEHLARRELSGWA
jgi:ferrochelatase